MEKRLHEVIEITESLYKYFKLEGIGLVVIAVAGCYVSQIVSCLTAVALSSLSSGLF